jgi:hypothetical protein
VVKDVSYSESGVVVTTAGGHKVEGAMAIITAPLGVLKSGGAVPPAVRCAPGDVTQAPPLLPTAVQAAGCGSAAALPLGPRWLLKAPRLAAAPQAT